MKSPMLLLLGGLSFFSLNAQAQKRKMPAAPSANTVYDSVAQPAVPLGGTERYAQFLASHQKYPTTAMQKGIQGTVKVSFVVEKTGTVNEVKVENPVSPELDAEAIRLIKSGPKWTPARHLRNQIVRQRVVVPISFVLSPGSTVTLPLPPRPPISPPRPTPTGPPWCRPTAPLSLWAATRRFSTGLRRIRSTPPRPASARLAAR
jgi:protein TonB